MHNVVNRHKTYVMVTLLLTFFSCIVCSDDRLCPFEYRLDIRCHHVNLHSTLDPDSDWKGPSPHILG